MSVVDKVRALLAKARDGGCSEAEAEACMERARRMMEEHGLEERTIGGGEDETTGQEVRPTYLEPWRKLLIDATARHYGCEALFFGSERRYILAGRAAARSVALEMIQWLDALVVRLAREWRKSTGSERRDQLNFERACGGRIASRLRAMSREREVASEREGGGGALVLIREGREASDWLARNYRVRTVTARSRVGGEGAAAGRAAGDGVGLGRQVGAARGAGGGRLLA